MVQALVAVHSELDVVDLRGDAALGFADGKLARVLSPQDAAAVRAAVAVCGTGNVTAICVGPEADEQWLRQCFELGAHTMVRVWDEQWDGRDAAALPTIAAVIAAAARRHGYDLVLTGSAGSAWGSSYVGPAVAELMDAPHAGEVASVISVGEGAVEVVEALTRGYRRRVRFGLPAVLSVGDSIEVPQVPAALPRMIEAQQVPIDRLTLDDLGVAKSSAILAQSLAAPRPRAKRSAAAGGQAALNAIMGGGKRPAKKSAAVPADPATQILGFLSERGITPWRSETPSTSTRA